MCGNYHSDREGARYGRSPSLIRPRDPCSVKIGSRRLIGASAEPGLDVAIPFHRDGLDREQDVSRPVPGQRLRPIVGISGDHQDVRLEHVTKADAYRHVPVGPQLRRSLPIELCDQEAQHAAVLLRLRAHGDESPIDGTQADHHGRHRATTAGTWRATDLQ